MFGVSLRQESEKRLDTPRSPEIAWNPVEGGFPAGEPGGRDAGSSLAMEDAALWGQHLPEGRFRLLPDFRADVAAATHESGKLFQNLRA